MRILFIADVPAGSPVSGAEQVLYQQVSGLAGRGHQVYAVTRRETGAAAAVALIGTTVTEGSFQARPADLFGFLAAHREHPAALFDGFAAGGPFDVAVVHQPFTALALLAGKRLEGLPLLYVFHSPAHEEYLLMHEGWSRIFHLLPAHARRLVERAVIRRAGRVMTLSGYMRDKAMGFHKLPAERMLLNPGGVDLERFVPAANRGVLKQALGFPPGKVHLLCIRNLEPRMGIENLLVAARALIRERQIPLHLILGGSGSGRARAEALVRELELSDAVTLTGFIPEADLPHYYAAADYFVIPTRKLEGFGLVTPESLACGTPVLGTPVGGTAEILGQFNRDFLFADITPVAIADGIARALDRHGTRGEDYLQLRKDCRSFASMHYSWQRHVDRLHEAVGELGREGNGKRGDGEEKK